MKHFTFFAYLGRMKYIKRWSLMRSTEEESVMEHSEQVAQIAHALAMINKRVFHGTVNAERAVTIAVFHEAPEVITGDLPTPIKYYNDDIRDAYKAIEHSAVEKLLNSLPEELREDYRLIIEPNVDTYEYKLAKAADKISAYLKCAQEVKCGNSEFNKALKTNLEEIKSSPLPEVRYFLENFAKGFELSLDELD